MKDCLAWAGITLAMLATLVFLYPQGQGKHAPLHSPARLTAASFTVHAFDHQLSGAGEDRNPFRYAPVSEQGNFDEALPDRHQASMNFPLLTLEGVLLRRSGEKAFVRIASHRRAVAVGEEIVDGFKVERIEAESMVLTNLWGKSRRYYVMP